MPYRVYVIYIYYSIDINIYVCILQLLGVSSYLINVLFVYIYLKYIIIYNIIFRLLTHKTQNYDLFSTGQVIKYCAGNFKQEEDNFINSLIYIITFKGNLSLFTYYLF